MLNRQIFEQAKKEKQEIVIYSLESLQLKAIWRSAKISTLFIIVTWFGTSALNWRSLYFMLSIGEYIPDLAAKLIAIPLGLAIGWALFQISFKKAMNTIVGEKLRFKKVFANWFFSFGSLRAIFLFGILGALLFLWGETQTDEAEIATAKDDIPYLENKIEQKTQEYKNDRKRIIEQIAIYTNLRLINLRVKPREAKLVEMKIKHEKEIIALETKLEAAKEAKNKFRATSFMSAIIDGKLWRRITVITIFAILLSLTIDLCQYSITNISTARAYSHGMLDNGEEGKYNIFNIYNKLIGTKNATDVTINATEDATVNDTVTPQTKTMNSTAVNNEDEQLIRRNVTHLNDTQDKMIQIIQAQIDKGAELGEINKSALAKKCDVDRRTIYRNWEEVTKQISIPTNGKHQEETV